MNPTEQARRHAFQQTLLSARRTMLASEILKLAVDSFRSSKLRFALTALGMVIGTASVIFVATVGLTGKQYVLQLIQKFGTNSVELEYAGGGAIGSEQVLYNDYLTRDDEKAVIAELPGVIYSSPVLEMHDRISFGSGITKDTLVLGVSPQYLQIHNLLVPVGRFLDETDDTAHIKCAVVTEKFAHDRFGSSDAAIGESFEISGIPFTIIGVFKMSVDDFGQSEIADQTILIPFSVARYFTGTENVKQIYFSMRNMEEVPNAAKEIVRIVQARHRPDSVYKVQTLKELLDTANKISNALIAVLMLVAAITLAVGGVGIMNIMYVVVTERTAEIGLKKAVGATNNDILAEFLIESIMVTVLGGAIGIVFGGILGWLVSVIANASGLTWTFSVPFYSILLAVGVSGAIGISFGVLPARSASKMDPIEALRYE